MMYKLMLPEEHDVQVTHFITSRGADVGGCVLASAVVCAAGSQDVLAGVHGLHLGHGVEGLGPLGAAPGDLPVLVTLLIVHIQVNCHDVQVNCHDVPAHCTRSQ